MASKGKEQYFEFVSKILEKGVNKATYEFRGRILYDIISKCNAYYSNSEILQCDVSAPYMVRELFKKNMPSKIKEITYLANIKKLQI